MELKNKNVYSVKNYDSHIDFKTFYERFFEIIEKPEYELLDINNLSSEGQVLKKTIK